MHHGKTDHTGTKTSLARGKRSCPKKRSTDGRGLNPPRESIREEGEGGKGVSKKMRLLEGTRSMFYILGRTGDLKRNIVLFRPSPLWAVNHIERVNKEGSSGERRELERHLSRPCGTKNKGDRSSRE